MRTYMSQYSMDKHREKTAKMVYFDDRTQVCPGCRRSRSWVQFAKHETCRTCRGLK
jgi:uncharacterized CHY-type Zn-finger protein